jgi:hypothetical protein
MQTVADMVSIAATIGELNPTRHLRLGTVVEEACRQGGWSFVYVLAEATPWYMPQRSAGPVELQIEREIYLRNRVRGGRATCDSFASIQGWVRSVALLPLAHRSDQDALTLYVNRRLWELTVQYDDVTYSQKVRDVSKGSIDCSGWVEFANSTIYDELANGVAEELLSPKFKKLFHTAAAWQITGWQAEAGDVMTGVDFDVEKLIPGMIIGMDASNADTDRPQGVDHIVQVAWHPITHFPFITQSSGGKGVNFEDLSTWFEKWKPAIGTNKLFAVDPYAKARVAINAWIAAH